jgi:AcrR family transcriptional regulator
MTEVTVRKRKLWDVRKKDVIQEAVIQLLSREGLSSVTMDRVAQEAGIAKGTVYLHYRDKQDLLDSAKDAALAPLVARVVELLRSDLPPGERLRAFAVRYISYFDDRRDFFRVLLYERQEMRVQGSRYQSDRYRELVEEVAVTIRQGIVHGEFREIDETKAAAIFVEGVIALIHQRLLTMTRTTPEEDGKFISQLLLNGIDAQRDVEVTTGV